MTPDFSPSPYLTELSARYGALAARADSEPLGKEYMVLRLDDELRDPETDKVLGYEVIFVGSAELRDHGNPDTLFLTDTNREARRGDKVKPIDLRLPLTFYPQAPADEVTGSIIAVVDGISLIGEYQMTIINRGSDHGLESGTVLAIWQKGKTVRDPEASGFNNKIQLPDTFAGNVMVVKAYEDVSYALVMEAVSEMRVGDGVRNP